MLMITALQNANASPVLTGHDAKMVRNHGYTNIFKSYHIAKNVIESKLSPRFMALRRIEYYHFVKNQFNLDVCSNDGHNFCKNGGTCYVEQENRIKCNCPQEFDGLYCEVGKKNIFLFTTVIFLEV